ncbi:MAG: hypothetical protein IPK83_11840 [Planctomycetes bacterium]|nr:hypothetical protein [Planctomycetota bacterium]
MTTLNEQLASALTRCGQHRARLWFGVVERTHTIGLADFMSKIFNE